MKKIFGYMIAAAALFGVVTSCVEGPLGYEVDKEAVVLEAYGPNPLLRGNDLTFIGQNLDKITSVVLPVDIEIPASEFKEVTANSFKVTVPIEAEAGAVTLYYEGGKITPVTELSYTEPFYLDGLEADDKLVQGDSVTVKGDYLNNIALIGFSGAKVTVPSEEFGTWNRYQITFAIPRGAASGKVYVADANGNQVFSEEDINVVQPTVAAVSPAEVRPGDVVAIAGTLLDQVDAVKFTGGSDITEFKSVTATKIEVEVPWNVQDGAVALTTAAGNTITTTNELVVKVPAALKVEAETVFKAGLNVVITGTDIDLVNGVSFASGVAQETFTNAEGKLSAAIPATAVDGVITLSMASGKTVETPAITLVKPTLTGLGAVEVVAGNTFTVAGTDLDLVTEVTLAGDKVEFTADSDKQLTVTTTATNKTGKVAVKTANGTTVESEAELTVTYDSFVIVNSLTSSASIGDEVTMLGSNFNMIEAIYFEDVKVTGYSKRADDEMVFTIPTTVDTGTYNLRFVLTTGDEETCVVPIEVKGALTTVMVWEGNTDLGNSWSVTVNLAWANYFKGIPYGATLHVEFEPAAASGTQIKLMRGEDWAVLQSFPGNEWGVVEMTEGTTHASYVLVDADVKDLDYAGLVVGGQNIVITKVYYTYENTGTDPIRPTDIMLVDYDDHGGHNGDWDGSWSSIGEIIDRYGDKSDQYFRVNADQSGEVWLMNCNHQANYTDITNWSVDAAENYVVKFDVMIEEGASSLDASQSAMQYVLGDGWYWVGPGFFPSTTGGKWITVSKPLSDLGLSGALDLSSGTNGCYGSGVPAGLCLDNLRLSLK